MKSILIPTDFSEISKNSIFYGFELASRLNLRVFLVHVIELYKFVASTSETEIMSTVLPVESIKEMEKAADSSFKKLINEIQDKLGNSVQYDYHIVPGHLVNEMIAESNNDNIELIILAVTVTQDLVTRFTQGAVSSIISEAACPVMVVPSAFSFKPFTKTLYVTDFNKADVNSLLHFISIFSNFNPEIIVLHITSKLPDFKTELKFAGFKQLIKEKSDYQNINYRLIQGKNVVTSILETAKSEQIDMLVMLKEHEGFFRSLFETSKTEKISHYLKIPMISYHEQDKNKLN
jgi:nucleotide-binding universal stress UspA family protein